MAGDYNESVFSPSLLVENGENKLFEGFGLE